MFEEPIASLELLRKAVIQQDRATVLRISQHLHYADIAQLFEEFETPEQGVYLAQTLDLTPFSEILPEIPDSLVESILESFSVDQRKKILEALRPDDRVDILQNVSTSFRSHLLTLLDARHKEDTDTLLKYDKETAGGRMTTQIGSITPDMDIQGTLEALRPFQAQIETMARIYVVDENGVLVGKVRLRDLVFADSRTSLQNVLQPVEHVILATTDQEKAAALFTKYDLTVLPVVDEFNHLLGVITHDDAMEILEEESTEDYEKLAGVAGEQSEFTYLQTSLLIHFKRRFAWLLALALLAILSGYVMFRFEEVMQGMFLLALFLPMVTAGGGNTGGQASVMVIRAMALGEIHPNDTLAVIWKELQLGFLLGSILGICMMIFATFGLSLFGFELPSGISFLRFGITIGLALAVQITASTLIGAVLPILAQRAKLDPAVIAAPAITTLVDVSGMLIYFTIARLLLNL